MNTEALERPLPKPTTEDYVSARLLEALVEASLAIRFLKDGLVRNAASKAFQAWRALLAALLRLELDKLLQIAKTDEERKWLRERAVPRVPTSRMKALSQLLESVGYVDASLWTDKALDLHDYQYNGPDPDMVMSKYRGRDEAAYDVTKLISGVVKYVEAIKERVKWDEELENAFKALKRELGAKVE
ncbi:PaREP1 domain containing protein [Vulcanisaeta moutnovskia 768-28]|uniref:PaREP1 domain containing protein n=1 Tax=Vulcanisaeta moutnovskia (strain 768-28) TaxID=985053 RepID=F0QSD9_VULM7|nr:PaREP1 family protein [Vulcanisaeta moutnovskia]ADY00290.1 PaREP1 domain containing protein [Vulcanisaeta moutnovskia 768-28]